LDLGVINKVAARNQGFSYIFETGFHLFHNKNQTSNDSKKPDAVNVD